MRNFMKIVEENSKRQLDELFKGKTYSLGWKRDEGNSFSASFMSGDNQYIVKFHETEYMVYDISFHINNGTTPTHDPSGTGDQYNVMTTIIEAVRIFINRRHPDVITFSGDLEDGHAKLYTAIVKRLKPELNSAGLTVETSSVCDGRNMTWTFEKDMGDDDDDAFESKNPNMRDIMNIYEAGLFPDAPRMIRIDPNVYKLMRALLFIANPEAYENNSNHDDAGMMVFGDEITYKETTEKLKSFGIPFKDDTEADVKTADGELMPDKEGQISPYPNNKAKKIKKKTITPNPFKHNS